MTARIVFLLGLCAVTVGIGMLHVPSAVIFAGICVALIGLSYIDFEVAADATDRPSRPAIGES